MSTLQTRLVEAFEHRKTLTTTHGKPSKAGLAKACKLTAASISQWFDGGTKSIRGEALIRAARYLGVSPGWLASGSGPMLTKDFEARPEGVPPLHQATIQALATALSKGKLTDMQCIDLMKSWLE